MGKAYAGRRADRPEGDFYATPYLLVDKLYDVFLKDLTRETRILECASGDGAISGRLREMGFTNVTEHDIRTDGVDFLTFNDGGFDVIITNPPFSLFDEFVLHAKRLGVRRFVFLGKTNFFGSHSRTVNRIFDNLESVWVFDRQIAYNHERREDGKAPCGCLVTGWFMWNMDWRKKWAKISVIDIDDCIVRRK